jgi:DNA ligase-1
VVAPLIVTASPNEIRAFHATQLSGGLEGAMVKQYDGEYQPGRTGWNWVKFKEAENTEGKLSDTVDGIVLGYYRGKGKRSPFGIGAFLLGIRNDEKDIFTTVAKIGTGLTDDQWLEMRRRADGDFSIEQPGTYVVPESLKPDVWCNASIVVEIAADEITKSPLHSSGFGLRFPRLVKFRDDKRADQITTLTELNEIKQASG